MTHEQFIEKLRSRPDIAARNPGACSKLQKHQVDLPHAGWTPVHRDKKRAQGMDGKDHPKFRVSVTFRCSDNYARDGDGMLSTILDCIVSASRRLADLDSRINGQMLSGGEGS